jgi:hypothetical protein
MPWAPGSECEEVDVETRRVLTAMIFGLAFGLFPVYTLSGDPPPEVIRFEGTAGTPMEAPDVFPRIYSGRVEFSHGKHFSTYGMTCGDCHHDDSGEPRTQLKPGGEVTQCIECHDEEGLVYGRRADEMADDQIVAHRANVIHKLCVGCHERTSAERRSIVAPIACRVCHAQRGADYVMR